MADCNSYVAWVNQTLSRNSNLLYGPIAQALRTKTPWVSVLRSGTFPSQVSATLVAVSQGRTFMGNSLAAPDFTSMINLCGSGGLETDQNGTNQWSYFAGITSGKSDRLCLNSTFSAFKESLISLVNAYQEGVTQLINADIRYQLFVNSGVKAVVQTGVQPAAMIAGGENQYQVAVPAIESDAELNVTTLQAFNRYMRSVLRAQPFGSGAAQYARLIAGPDLLDRLRDSLGGAAYGTANIMPLGALAAGGDRMATDGLKSYLFEQLFRGIEYGEDQIPLRLNWNGSGYDPVNPDIADAATAGVNAVTSPDWLEASHEVAFLIYEGSFQRLTPEAWTGESKVRFDRQLFGGDIQFINNRDMDCNMFGDWGVLAHRIGRAYKPLRPWFVLPIIFKRCIEEPALETCTGVSG
jgi:hypothetical protein